MIEPSPNDDPIQLVAALLARAHETESTDATRFVLATVDADGQPGARFLLLKSVTDRGFGFVTNRESRKGRALIHEPRAAIALHWPTLDVQVRAEGAVRQAPDADSDAYFATRARESQIGAWASPQSRPIESRAELEARVSEVEAQFAGRVVSRPPHWVFWFLVPTSIELWYGRPSRLHDRYRYDRRDVGYAFSRLAP